MKKQNVLGLYSSSKELTVDVARVGNPLLTLLYEVEIKKDHVILKRTVSRVIRALEVISKKARGEQPSQSLWIRLRRFGPCGKIESV